MKGLNTFSVIIFLVLITSVSYGQSMLYGTWKVNCPFEKKDASSGTVCSICPSTIKNVSFSILPFDMIIDKTSLTIKTDSETTSLTYNWKNDVDALEFQYKKTDYSFKVLNIGAGGHYLLKDTNGCIIILTKH
ncbi:MAG: hypothetical protein V4651_06440 [Bacteroidota bacterium]